MNTKRVLILSSWILAIAVAMACDRGVATWVRHVGSDEWLRSHRLVTEIFKAPGVYATTVIIAIVVMLKHPLRWRAAAFLLLATGASGVSWGLKLVVGRTRPFRLQVFGPDGQLRATPFHLTPFPEGLHNLLGTRNLCFPSGHAALAFATAAALAMLWPNAKWRWAAFVVAGLVAVERVVENAHWLSDVVAAVALGIGCVHVVRWLVMRYFPPPAPLEARGPEVIANE